MCQHGPELLTCHARQGILLACKSYNQGLLVQLGAQVMLLRNLEMERRSEMLVNGSRGVITGFWKKQASDPDILRR